MKEKYFYDEQAGRLLVLDAGGVRSLLEVGTEPIEEVEEEIEEKPRRTYTKRTKAEKKPRKAKGKYKCKFCGELGHSTKTCPLTGNYDLRLKNGEQLPSDNEVSEEHVSKKDMMKQYILQGLSNKEIAPLVGTSSDVVASFRSRMKRHGELPIKIERHDPDDLSDLADIEEEEQPLDIASLVG